MYCKYKQIAIEKCPTVFYFLNKIASKDCLSLSCLQLFKKKSSVGSSMKANIKQLIQKVYKNEFVLLSVCTANLNRR